MTAAHDRGFVLADRYRLREAIGEGGFAKVYRATDSETDASVAVKVPNYEGSSNEPDVIDQYLEREAQTLERIQRAGGHPNLMSLHDCGWENDTVYLVVEHVDGYDLDEAIDRTGPLDKHLAEQVRQVGIALCDAVSFLHESEIVYRDLKPDNVMLTGDDGGPRPVLIDFNTATDVDREGRVHDSETTILGPYKPPEIAEAELSDVRQGPWSDVYSIGKILLFLLKGTVPQKDGVNPRKLGVDCDPYLAAIVEKATRTAYDNRFRNATSMKRVLEAKDPSEPPEASVTYLPTGEEHTVHPGDTVGRRGAPGPTPSIEIEDQEEYVSTVQVEFDLADSGADQRSTGGSDVDDWILRDHSLNGTYVQSDGTWHRVLSERGSEQLREQGADPTGPDGETPPATYPLSRGDLVALVHPSRGLAFQFGGP